MRTNSETAILLATVIELQKDKVELEAKLEASVKKIKELEAELKVLEFGMYQDLGR